MGRKHPADLLLAAARVKSVPVEVTFAGAGDLEPELKEIARREGVNASFTGFRNQSELPAVYAGADLLVLPSDGLETWGLVVNEAMACGLPAIVSDAVGCGPDLVETGKTGAIFPLGDVSALADAIETVLGLDPEATRRHVIARVDRYSPAACALGIVRAVATIGQSGRV